MPQDIGHRVQHEPVRRSPLAPFTECPLCGAAMTPEHAHFRCRHCGWRDSCCD